MGLQKDLAYSYLILWEIVLPQNDFTFWKKKFLLLLNIIIVNLNEYFFMPHFWPKIRRRILILSSGAQKGRNFFQVWVCLPPPEDCRVTRETNDSLTVVCQPAWSGGFTQTFHLELWDGKEKELLRNVTEKRRPRFELN